MDTINCPRCGSTYWVPPNYTSSEDGKQHRTCSCDYFQETLSGGSVPMDKVATILNEHGKLLQILMRCFPRTQAASPPQALWSDLKIDVSRIPEPMKERAIKRFKANNASVDANITVCKYCGDSYNNGTATVGGGIAITDVYVCPECDEVRKLDPRAFGFVTSIFQWIYGDPEPAPPAVLPIPTPEPKPDPENKRNIVL